MTSGDETITIPRPGPDEAILAVCGEDGAIAWVAIPKTYCADDQLQLSLPQMLALLADSQQVIREQRAKGAA